ncbi:MAG TPA: hypothetical protein VKN99_16890, partial [Polyangia bacterium]|nr:hypothetical protein [Polyangia bacterium]
LSQPSVFGLPLAAWAQRGFGRRTLLWVAPALVLVFAITVGALLGKTVAIQPQAQAAFPLRLFRTLGYSLSLPFRPFDLRPVYVLSPARWSEPWTWLGIASLLGVGAAFAVRSLRPLLTFLVATVLPVSNLLPLAKEIGDAHLYLPLVPLCGLYALGLQELATRLRLRTGLQVATAAVLPLALIPATLAQSARWHDGIRLWSAMMERNPDVPQVCSHLGVAYAQSGQPGRALALFESCAQAHHARDFYLYNMVIAARDAGEAEKLRALLDELSARHPEHPLVRELRRKTPAPGPP